MYSSFGSHLSALVWVYYVCIYYCSVMSNLTHMKVQDGLIVLKKYSPTIMGMFI